MKNRITRRRFVSAMAAVTAAPRTGDIAVLAAEGFRESIRNDKHDVGEVLSYGKPYFPMLLGNGLEYVLIGYAGAMGACAGHERWSYGTSLTGWFRPDLRHRPQSGVLSLLQCSYIVRRWTYADAIDRAEQAFDARDGVLISNCHLANAEVSVRTFLTNDSCLIHRFAVTPRAGSMAMQFFVRTATGGGPLRVVTDPKNVLLPGTHDSRVMTFEIVGEGLGNTPGRLLCDHPKATKVTCYNNQQGIEVRDSSAVASKSSKVTCYNNQQGIEVPLSGPSEFTFVVQCGHAGELQEPADNEPHNRFDFPLTFKQHTAEWQQFDSHSTVHIARKAIDAIYRTSLYTIRAHQNPTMGGITVGGYTGMWWNEVDSYDVSYSLLALLGANRMREAELIVQFWQRIQPFLRERTREAHLPGIMCPDGDGISSVGWSPKKSREDMLEEGHYRTANITLHVWQLYQYSGRLRVLEKYWDCLVEPVEFLLGVCVKEYADHAEIIRSSGGNGKQRVDGKVVYPENPTMTLLATIEAVRAVSEAAALLGKKADPRWKALLPKLERGRNVNRFGGAVRENRDPRASAYADTAYVSLFNCLTDEKTLSAENEYYMSPEGLLRWPDEGERVVPWMHLRLSAVLSRLGLPDAARMLDIGSEFTTTLHGFPEEVWPDGVYTKTWYPTVHAAFVHAVNLLLLCRRGDVVELFAGLPTEWGDASFRALRAPLGLVVSGSRTGEKITAEATNDSDRAQRIRFRASGPKAWEKTVLLEPGEKVALPS